VLVERVGAGTEYLHALAPGAELEILTGLGSGFELLPGHPSPLLIGCGSGLSPLVGLARRLALLGVKPRVLLGFREEGSRFGEEFFPGLEVHYAEDLFLVRGSIPHDFFYACGSETVMTELCRRDPADGQVAFDVRMGCGFGACMGCARKTRDGMKRVCKDGPVFRKELLIWED
jgi:dihydroorotate dehydrogenase electron transfer subunit